MAEHRLEIDGMIARCACGAVVSDFSDPALGHAGAITLQKVGRR